MKMAHKVGGGGSTLICWLLVGLIYTAFSPWVFWYARGELSAVFAVLLLLLFLQRKTNHDNYIAFWFLFLLSLFYLTIMGAYAYVSLVLSLSVSLIAFLNRTEIIRSSIIFKKTLAIICLPGLALWLIHVLSADLGLLKIGTLPSSIVSDLKTASGVKYVLYPFSVRLETANSAIYFPGMYRFQSVFDEPGFLGTVCALYLAGEKAGRSDFDRYSFVLLLSGIATFSLAFYIILFVFILLLGVKSLKTLVYGLLVASLVLAPFFYYTDFLDMYLLSRLELSDGQISGDNRSTQLLDQAFMAWWNSPSIMDVLLGIGYQNDGSSSWKLLFVKGGVAGLVLLLLFYILVFYRFINSKNIAWPFLAFLFVFLLSSYQRVPGVSIIYVFLMINAMIQKDSSRERKAATEHVNLI